MALPLSNTIGVLALDPPPHLYGLNVGGAKTSLAFHISGTRSKLDVGYIQSGCASVLWSPSSFSGHLVVYLLQHVPLAEQMLAHQKHGIQPKPGRQTQTPIQLSNIQPRSRKMPTRQQPKRQRRGSRNRRPSRDCLARVSVPMEHYARTVSIERARCLNQEQSQTGKFPEPLGTIPEPLLLTGSRRKIGEEEHHWRAGNVSA
jgi:hypothetical protein